MDVSVFIYCIYALDVERIVFDTFVFGFLQFSIFILFPVVEIDA